VEIPDGLLDLPIVYPGIPSIVMKPTEIITTANFKKFQTCLRKYTCGTEMQNITAAWKRGFSAVMPWEAMSVFTDQELCRLFRGSLAPFSIETLQQNVSIGHGYNENSPQIGMLFDTILGFDEEERSLFLKFVTGSRSLPVGGLAALAPKLTIDSRVVDDGSTDAAFPSVMTCAHYLKLPEYSSQEVLRERLIYAIHECQNSFDLT
jgi:E3 ubiquitin-protein ligase TRIP12